MNDMKRLTSLLLVGMSALAVSACGLRGDLERPPPLWGNPVDAEETTSEDGDSSDQRQR